MAVYQLSSRDAGLPSNRAANPNTGVRLLGNVILLNITNSTPSATTTSISIITNTNHNYLPSGIMKPEPA